MVWGGGLGGFLEGTERVLWSLFEGAKPFERRGRVYGVIINSIDDRFRLRREGICWMGRGASMVVRRVSQW